MPTNEYGKLISTGHHNGIRAGFRTVNGIGRVALENHRHRCIALRDDPNRRQYEDTPSGVQRPVWTPTVTAAATGGTMESSKTYYVCCTYYSSRYKRESNPGPVVSVSLGESDTEIQLTAGSSDVNFIAPVENTDTVPDAVDRIRIYRTTASQTEVASTDENATAIGTWYRALEIPVHSLSLYDDWAESTAYAAGDLVKITVSGFLRRYRCVQAHTSSAPFANDLAAGYWFLLGQSPALIRLPDADIAFPANELRVDRGLPPGCWSMAFKNNRIFLTGRRDRSIHVDLTNGSAVVTITQAESGARDRFYDGDVGMEFVADDSGGGLLSSSPALSVSGETYAVDAWLDRDTVHLSRPYEGRTATNVTAFLRATPGAVYYSNITGSGLSGAAPRPDEFAGDNVMLYKPDDGLGNEALIEGRDVVYVIKRNSIGAFRNAGDIIEEIEQRSILTLGDRNLARGASGEWYGVGSDGVFVFEDPGPSRLISEPVRDMWEPRKNTAYSWEPQFLERSVLVYHPRLHWLIMVGPKRGESNNSLGLIWDRRSDAWCIFQFWRDGTVATPLNPDITYGTVVNIGGREEVILCGRMVASSGGESGDIDTEYIGRMWLVESGFRDEMPKDKLPQTHHRIPYQRAFRPFTSDTGQRVDIVRITTRSEASQEGDERGFGVAMRTQTDTGPETNLTGLHWGSLRKFHNRFTPEPNMGRRSTAVLFGTVAGPSSEMTAFEEITAEARVLGTGMRD